MSDKAKVTEGWAGPGRRDALIEPLETVDDGLHMDKRGMYEWWYFDAHLDNGYTIVVFFHASNPNPGLEGKTGMEIVLVKPDGMRVQKFVPYNKSDFTAARDKAEVTIGKNTLRVDQADGELLIYLCQGHFGTRKHYWQTMDHLCPLCFGYICLLHES